MLARAYLRGLGWEIVDTNYRSRFGEIDIIAIDGQTVAFVEVRARRHTSFAAPGESVTAAKRRKLAATASCWLAERQDCPDCRFDVLEVELIRGGGRVSGLVKGAFDLSDVPQEAYAPQDMED